MAKKDASLTEILIAAIKASGKTDYALAKEAGISPIMVGRFLRGERDLKLKTVEKIAAVLGLTFKAS